MENEKKMIALKINIELATEILKFLSLQPYNQVFTLIKAFQDSEPVYAEDVQVD